MSISERRRYLRGLANYCSVNVQTWSPGDGKIRFHFYPHDDDSKYFGPSSPMGYALGLGSAITWLEGYKHGKDQGMRLVDGVRQNDEV
jgi:hypothetical protein